MDGSNVRLAAATALAASLALGWAPAAAVAGPCAEQIAEVARTLSMDPSMGAATTGALAGAAPGAAPSEGPAAKPAQSSDTAPAPSLATGGKTGGEGGLKEMNAASSQVATSSQDVRLQQEGKPTAAQGGNIASVDNDPKAKAKSALESARLLDQQNSPDCTAKVEEAKRLAEEG